MALDALEFGSGIFRESRVPKLFMHLVYSQLNTDERWSVGWYLKQRNLAHFKRSEFAVSMCVVYNLSALSLLSKLPC